MNLIHSQRALFSKSIKVQCALRSPKYITRDLRCPSRSELWPEGSSCPHWKGFGDLLALVPRLRSGRRRAKTRVAELKEERSSATPGRRLGHRRRPSSQGRGLHDPACDLGPGAGALLAALHTVAGTRPRNRAGP